AGRNDADDAVAGQRVAAAGEMHRHTRDEAADRHRVLRRLTLARPRQRDDLARLAVGLVIDLLVLLRREDGVDDLAPGEMPLAHRDEEVVDAGAVETLEH